MFTEYGPAVLVRCPLCGADSERKRGEYLRQICGLSDEEARWRLSDFWTNTTPRQKAAAAARQVLAQNGWLSVVGGYGTGKTFLLCAITNEARFAGKVAVYVTMARLMEHLRRGYKPGAEIDSDSFWDNIVRSSVLCLDEAEKYNPTPWAEEKIIMLLDERYRQYSSCATVLAANDIEQVPGYVKSRMLDRRFNFVELTGESARIGADKRGG